MLRSYVTCQLTKKKNGGRQDVLRFSMQSGSPAAASRERGKNKNNNSKRCGRKGGGAAYLTAEVGQVRPSLFEASEDESEEPTIHFHFTVVYKYTNKSLWPTPETFRQNNYCLHLFFHLSLLYFLFFSIVSAYWRCQFETELFVQVDV